MAIVCSHCNSVLTGKTGSVLQKRMSVPLVSRPTFQVHGTASCDQLKQRKLGQTNYSAKRLSYITKAAAGAVDSKADTEEPSVEEVMNPHPVLLKASMPIKEAVHQMLDADVSGAPVVDDDGHLVGILSESDVIWKGAGAPQDHFIIPPIFIGFADAFIYLRDNKQFEEEVHKILAKTVAEAMTADVLSVKPETPMSAAAQLMLHKQVNLLPVESDGKVVGVITRHDILRGIYASKSPFL